MGRAPRRKPNVAAARMIRWSLIVFLSEGRKRYYHSYRKSALDVEIVRRADGVLLGRNKSTQRWLCETATRELQPAWSWVRATLYCQAELGPGTLAREAAIPVNLAGRNADEGYSFLRRSQRATIFVGSTASLSICISTTLPLLSTR